MDALLEIQDCLQYSKGEKAKKKETLCRQTREKGWIKRGLD